MSAVIAIYVLIVSKRDDMSRPVGRLLGKESVAVDVVLHSMRCRNEP